MDVISNIEELSLLQRPKNTKKAMLEVVCQVCGKHYEMSYYCVLHKPNAFLCMRCKTEKTLEAKYGDKHYVGKRDIKKWQEKAAATMKQKYGVENPGQMSDHQSKCEATSIEKYGSLQERHKQAFLKSNETKIEHYGSLEAAKEVMLQHQRQTTGKFNVSQTEKWVYTRMKHTCERYQKLYSDRGEFFEKDGEFFFKCGRCGVVHNQKDSTWSRCYECFPLNKNPHYSEEQNEVALFLKQFTDVRQNVKSFFPNNGKLEVDIVTDKLLVEYDGAYWHNNHKDVKQDLAKSMGKDLIRIFDYEWETKKDIIKNVLKSKLGIYDKILYARKCIVKEISNNEYREFCNENHIQGYSPASIKMGLYYNDELIQIMSFSKPRYSNEQYEMIRECSKGTYHIVGGKGKLLKHFEMTYKPKSLISYCDKRYFNGGSYEALGFQLSKETAPAFSVLTQDGIKNRMEFTKPKMARMTNFKFNESLTQIENIIENDMIVLWDNGTKVYKKTY